jgi:hypothetical protein
VLQLYAATYRCRPINIFFRSKDWAAQLYVSVLQYLALYYVRPTLCCCRMLHTSLHFYGRWYADAEADDVLAGGANLRPVEVHPTLTHEGKRYQVVSR